MEKDQKLEKTISDLKKNWEKGKSARNDKLEEALKKVVTIDVSAYHASIKEFENISNRSKNYKYKRLTDEQKKEADKQYERKVNQIKRFLGTLAGVIIKTRSYEPSETTLFKVAKVMDKENYFDVLGATISDYAFNWIGSLYSHYLIQICEETPITYNGLSNSIRKEILSDNTIDEWSKYFQNEDFDGLAKWVKEFVDSINKNMINESKRDVEQLKSRINPKFYLVKTENDCAIVYSEKGQLYVFPKGKAPIQYPENSNVNSQDFKRIRETNPTAFPEFHPEEW